jgi:hypothetical protein
MSPITSKTMLNLKLGTTVTILTNNLHTLFSHFPFPHSFPHTNKQTPPEQLAAALKSENFELCARLTPFVRAFDHIQAQFAAAETPTDYQRCAELKAEFPKTLEAFEAQVEILMPPHRP